MKIPSWDIPKKILQNRINYVKFAKTSLTTVEYCDISRAEKNMPIGHTKCGGQKSEKYVLDEILKEKQFVL